MSYLLHIDTATDTGTVSMAHNGVILASRTNTESRNHAATINIMIQDVLAEAGITMQQIDAVAVCGGPGSYTGLRIGMATAKGLCFALDKPLIAIDRLTLLAYKTWLMNKDGSNSYTALITAREKEYFIATYDADFKCIIAPQHILETQLEACIEVGTCIIGDVREEIIDSLKIDNLNIISDVNTDLAVWAKYAQQQFDRNENVTLASAEPFYLKQVYTHK